MSDEKSLNFLEEIIRGDIENGKNGGNIITRFPPEPNGFLHIGHVTSALLNFGLAKKYGGRFNLRFDDTNPITESVEYIDAIKKDLEWLGVVPDEIHYASDYFETLYQYATNLIKLGLAYVDDSTSEEMAVLKSTGAPSPYRDREIEENLRLFAEMRAGVYKDGEKTLRAKIDPGHPNYILRDPMMYRIKHATHHRTGDSWCIYPMYDFAHGQSDSIEKITHSLCTLEFAQHRPLYDWFIEALGIFPSQQYEFARRNMSYTVTSKRKLLQLVTEGHVEGWDDPRMPTISGMRRRGYPAVALREFVKEIGVAKRENLVELNLLESHVRTELNRTAKRAMAVFNPVRVIIRNYPAGLTEYLQIENNPEDPSAGVRTVPFTKEIYIEQEDFMKDPIKGFHRLVPGGMVRLKGGYIIKNIGGTSYDDGTPKELICEYIPESKSGNDTSGLKPKAVIHWVSANHCKAIEVRMYDRLFSHPDPSSESDFIKYLNPDSLKIWNNVFIEESFQTLSVGECVQFMRKGYFSVDSKKDNKLIFNLTVPLKDSWGSKNK